ncbi:MAG: hypothetical protein HY696_10320 [Deltaproteobacteria bacterium]|nr:hypothetical protein [Deltaproteobacteria bacterium]
MGPRIDSLLPLTRILAAAPPPEAPPPAGTTPTDTSPAEPAQGLILHHLQYARAIINYHPDTKTFSGSLIVALKNDFGLSDAEIFAKLNEKNVVVFQAAKGTKPEVRFTGQQYGEFRTLADRIDKLGGELFEMVLQKAIDTATGAEDAKRLLDTLLTRNTALNESQRKGLVDKLAALNRGDAKAKAAFLKEFRTATKGKLRLEYRATAMRTNKALTGIYLPDLVDFAIGAARRMADVAISMASQRLLNETDQAKIEAKADEILKDPTVFSEADAKSFDAYTVASLRSRERASFEVMAGRNVDPVKTEAAAVAYLSRLHNTSVKLKQWAAANKVEPLIRDRRFERVDDVTVTISQRKCGDTDGDICVGGATSVATSTGIKDGGGVSAEAEATLSYRYNDMFGVGAALATAYARKNMGLTDYGTFVGPQNPGQDFKFSTALVRASLWGNKGQLGGLTAGGGLFLDDVEEYPWAGIFLNGHVGYETAGKEFGFKVTGGVKGLFARAPYQLSEEDVNGEIDYTGASINAGIELSFIGGALTVVVNYANLIESTDDESGDAEGNIHQVSGKISGKVGDLWVPMAKVVFQDRYEPLSVLILTLRPAHFKTGPITFGPSYTFKRLQGSGALLQAGDATNPVDCQGIPIAQCKALDEGSSTTLTSNFDLHRVTAQVGGEIELSTAVTLEFSADLGWEGVRRYVNDTEGAGMKHTFYAGGLLKLGFGTTRDQRSDPVRKPGAWRDAGEF